MITDIFIMLSVLFIAMMSPGPDMMLIMRYSLSNTPKSAMFCVLGICAGVCVHTALALFGVAALIAGGGLAYKIAKLIGAGYLIYVGVMIFRSTSTFDKPDKSVRTTYLRAFRRGFLTNVLNPKVMIFILALFTQIIDPASPIQEKLFMIVIMLVAVFVIWSSFALIIRHPQILKLLQKRTRPLNIGVGIVLIIFGIGLAIKP